MHPAINQIKVRTIEEVGGLWTHEGEEFLYVLNGSVVIHTDLYAPTILNEGDSLYFDGSQPHAYLNAGDDPAQILVVVGPSGLKGATI
jgi:quercetin dioxygenase-like cupin family protein